MNIPMNGVRQRRRPHFSFPEKDTSPSAGPLGSGYLIEDPSPEFPALQRPDFLILALVTLLAVATRFYRLGHPAAVVFDELHFQKFVDRHLSHIWYFDIHPPLGKLVLAYAGVLFGYKNDPSFIIKKIGNEYPATVNHIALRTVSALFSVATIPLTYVLSRSLRFSRPAAFFTTFQALTCFLGTIEGRLILMDSQLLFLCQLTLFSALALWRTRAGERRRWALLATTGLCAGMALCIKHTALATPALIAIVSFFGLHFLAEPLAVREYLFAGAIAVVAYTLPFYPLLTRRWTTGDKYDKFMKYLPAFQKTIIDSKMYDPVATRPNFLKSFLFMNYRMLASNMNVKKRHTWESTWWQWIVNWRGVLYYTKRLYPLEEGKPRAPKAIIYLIGNPVESVLVLACVLVFTATILVLSRAKGDSKAKLRFVKMYNVHTGMYLLAGWVCNLAPYLLVRRAAFLYHYMPALFYGQLLSGVIVDFLPPRARKPVVALLCAALAAAFVYWSPWIYGFYITDRQHKARQWMRRWN